MRQALHGGLCARSTTNSTTSYDGWLRLVKCQRGALRTKTLTGGLFELRVQALARPCPAEHF
eukprot:15475465-Alexandrium_andersonii.AAC.1